MKLKHIIAAVLLSTLYNTHANAQIGELRQNLAIGFNGGMNFNTVSFTPTVTQKTLSGINGGLSIRYISEKYFNMICGALLEINFSQHGWDEYYKDYPQLTYTRTMNYVEIPFLAHLAWGKERGLQFFIHAGPQIGFLLSDSEKQSNNWDNYDDLLETEQHGKKIQNNFDYGITGGMGIELRTKAGNFLLEGRYYYALSDFFKSAKRDPFSRSAHGVIAAKLSYLFDIRK